MLEWFRRLLHQRARNNGPIEIHLDGPTECRVERLGDNFDVIIQSVGWIIGTDARVEIKIILSEPDLLRQLAPLMMAISQHLDPPN